MAVTATTSSLSSGMSNAPEEGMIVDSPSNLNVSNNAGSNRVHGSVPVPHRLDVNVEIDVPPMTPRDQRVQWRTDWEHFLTSGPALVVVNENHETRVSVDKSKLPEQLLRSFQSFRIEFESSVYNTNELQSMFKAHEARSEPFSITMVVPDAEITMNVLLYSLSNEEPDMEELEPMDGGNNNSSSDEQTSACESWSLPHRSLDGAWDSLIMPEQIKDDLLRYAQSALLFSERGVSSHIISWNRLLLLHGPPGTGKTSLCRALAQKLSIRLQNTNTSTSSTTTRLLEIQSHSLFSKWFSTSGKLVHRLFELVQEMVEETGFVCVLIDEVESLAASRSGHDGDPADAMRAVNALLTSLDRLKQFPNVLILATTNLTQRVDEAFLDRADLALHVGYPTVEARYAILRSCLLELLRVSILTIHSAGAQQKTNGGRVVPVFAEYDNYPVGVSLWEVANAADGFSGRLLKRLPLQCHATLRLGMSAKGCDMLDFLEALLRTLSPRARPRLV